MKILIFAACVLVTAVMGLTSDGIHRFQDIYKKCCRITDCKTDKYSFETMYCASMEYDVYKDDGSLKIDGFVDLLNEVVDNANLKNEALAALTKCLIAVNKEKGSKLERAKQFVPCARPILQKILPIPQ